MQGGRRKACPNQPRAAARLFASTLRSSHACVPADCRRQLALVGIEV